MPLPPSLAVPLTPALLTALLGAADVAAPAAQAPAVDYTRDIAPLLAARCYHCHGPDASSRKAGLRLDKRAAAIGPPRDGESRPAIVPGDPDASELMARVTSLDADLRMPPTDGHAALSPAEVAALRAWIAAGAPYAKHWSWEPLPPIDGEVAKAIASGKGYRSALHDVEVTEQVVRWFGVIGLLGSVRVASDAACKGGAPGTAPRPESSHPRVKHQLHRRRRLHAA